MTPEDEFKAVPTADIEAAMAEAVSGRIGVSVGCRVLTVEYDLSEVTATVVFSSDALASLKESVERAVEADAVATGTAEAGEPV